MIDVIEDVRNEFKVKLTDKFEKEDISFLNLMVAIFILE
ncbi:unknown [Clostridium sp. CAG:762]|nr:unknown [Clostridium sp. CAG:762]